jgi:predicted nucleic acid-binding protein
MSRVLVDTSIWVDHLRRKDPHLAALLLEGRVACHRFVIGELACGNLANRAEILSLLKALPSTQRMDDEEALYFIERHGLMGLGVGIVDVHLLAAALLSRHPLWTSDKRLRNVAERLGSAYQPA